MVKPFHIAAIIAGSLLLLSAMCLFFIIRTLEESPPPKSFKLSDPRTYGKSNPKCKNGGEFDSFLRYDCITPKCVAMEKEFCMESRVESDTFDEILEEDKVEKILPCLQMAAIFANKTKFLIMMNECYPNLKGKDIMLSSSYSFFKTFLLGLLTCLIMTALFCVLLSFFSYTQKYRFDGWRMVSSKNNNDSATTAENSKVDEESKIDENISLEEKETASKNTEQ